MRRHQQQKAAEHADKNKVPKTDDKVEDISKDNGPQSEHQSGDATKTDQSPTKPNKNPEGAKNEEDAMNQSGTTWNSGKQSATGSDIVGKEQKVSAVQTEENKSKEQSSDLDKQSKDPERAMDEEEAMRQSGTTCNSGKQSATERVKEVKVEVIESATEPENVKSVSCMHTENKIKEIKEPPMTEEKTERSRWWCTLL